MFTACDEDMIYWYFTGVYVINIFITSFHSLCRSEMGYMYMYIEYVDVLIISLQSAEPFPPPLTLSITGFVI